MLHAICSVSETVTVTAFTTEGPQAGSWMRLTVTAQVAQAMLRAVLFHH